MTESEAPHRFYGYLEWHVDRTLNYRHHYEEGWMIGLVDVDSQ